MSPFSVTALRNVLIGIGNSGRPELAGAARRRLDEASPLVRATAVWALGQLSDDSGFAAEHVCRLPGELDLEVRREWTAR